MIDLTKYDHIPYTDNPKYKRIPVTRLYVSDESAHIFNEILDYIKSIDGISELKVFKNPITGLSICRVHRQQYYVNTSDSSIELIAILYIGCYIFHFRSKPEEINGEILSGSKAFTEFKRILKKYNINITDYEIDNGPDIKEEIKQPLIKLEKESFRDIEFKSVHHIDFHNSYPAGLANTHPEFRPAIEECYEQRKENPKFKAILNYSIGYMQSISCCNARWAHLSRDAMNDNYDRVLDLANKIKSNGGIIILYNTDGFWYAGDIYHGNGEGPGLGQWHNDHVNCKFRAKSDGAYEYVENNEYHPVVRGKTKLDCLKPREEWVWGDIYNEDAIPLEYEYTADGGITRDGKRL